MAVKDYYELLELPPGASAEEIKRAFRHQIARYHPDKVQHLGQEFQQIAADRAAELTEAWRILSDEKRRAEYDAWRGEATANAAPPAAPPAEPHAAPAVPPPPPAPARPSDGSFTQERASRDTFVRQALVGRFRQALDAVAGDYDRSNIRGFDVACSPKSRLFGRSKGPKLLARFVDRVDAQSIADTWAQAVKAIPSDEVCVFLMGSSMAPAGELATAISDQRRKARAAKVTLIPIDARDWEARMPTDAPPIAKTLLTRLRTGA